jgi:hypothetical protein
LTDGPDRSDTATFIQAIMSDVTAPALSAAGWSGVLGQQDGLKHLREQFGTLPFSTHAIAALLLYEQPFGFTQQDATEEGVSDRHEARSAWTAALLPPVRAAQG